MIYYKVTLKVKNEVGVLARIATLLRKFQINIQSMDATTIDVHQNFSLIHMTLQASAHNIDVALQKTLRLVPVIEIRT